MGDVAEVKDPAVEKPAAGDAGTKVEKPVQEAKVEKPAAGGAAKPAPKTEVVDAKVRRVRVEDDDEIPEDAEIVEMTQRSIKHRLTRTTNKDLDELHGHHDRAKIAADMKELAELRISKETDRKSKLDEVTRLKEEKQAAEAKATAAEERATEVEAAREVAEAIDGFKEHQDGVVKKPLAKFVRGEFKEHLAELAETEPKEFEGLATNRALVAYFKKWQGKFLKDNPEYAAGNEEPAKGLNSGAKVHDDEKGDTATPKPGEVGGKTARPGQANSMSPEEFKKHMASKGLTA